MPDELNYLMYLRQTAGVSGTGYLPVALLVGLMVAAVFRPERIRLPALFAVSCILLALSIMTPPALSALIAMVDAQGSTPASARAATGTLHAPWIASMVNASGLVLLGLSIIFGLMSLLPTGRPAHASGPAKHPLEQRPPTIA